MTVPAQGEGREWTIQVSERHGDVERMQSVAVVPKAELDRVLYERNCVTWEQHTQVLTALVAERKAVEAERDRLRAENERLREAGG